MPAGVVTVISKPWQSIAVIVAGYTDEMDSFIAANPGLASRFARTIEFANYSVEELVLITGRRARAGDYELTGGEDLLAAYFAEISTLPAFGNARDARKLFDEVRKAQSPRLRGLGRTPTMEELRTLCADDVAMATGVRTGVPTGGASTIG